MTATRFETHMQAYYIVIYALAGLIIGSFLNVVIARLKTAESFLIGYSKCPGCQKRIKWYDLIPLLSFVLLRAKCRNCKEKISWQYPAVEASCALLFILSYYLYGLTWESALAAAFFSLLVVIITYDFKEMAIPDSISWLALMLVLVGQLVLSPNSFGSIILGGVLFGGVIFLLVFISKGKWMGDGDIKVAAALGIFLGFPLAVCALFFSFITGALVGSALIAFKIKKAKDQLPFTPFLALGMLITAVWGQRIIDWYLGRFVF